MRAGNWWGKGGFDEGGIGGESRAGDEIMRAEKRHESGEWEGESRAGCWIVSDVL